MVDDHRNYRERRIQTRYAVDLHAKVRGRNQLPTNCRVRNICNGGVLLETGQTDIELPFTSGEHVDIHFDLPDAQSMDPVQAVIEVVHRLDRGIGARFVRLVGDGRTRLARFISATAAEQSPGEAELDPGRAKAREVFQEVGERRLGGMLDSLLEKLIEELWRHSERAGNDSERTHLGGEIGALAKAIQDETLPRRLLAELLDLLKDVGRPGAYPPAGAAPGAAGDGLQLVDQDDFEVWLAKSELANRLEQELHEPLEALRANLAALFQESALPMDPMGLAEAIEKTLREIGFGIELQRLSLQIVAKHLSGNLGSFYREVLRAWDSAGLSEGAAPAQAPGVASAADLGPAGQAPDGPTVAEAGTAQAPGQSAPAPSASAPSASAPAASAPAASAPSVSAPAASAYRETAARPGDSGQAAGLIASLLARHPTLGARAPRRSYAGAHRIAELLQSLPADFQMPEPDPSRPLRELIAQWLRAADSKKSEAQPDAPPVLSPQVEERVDVTDRLLTHMLADPSTPQRLKTLIKPLSRRFLSMAVSEPGRVADSSIPLVSLVDRLEHLALFLLSDENDPQLERDFEEVVGKLVVTDGRDQKGLETLTGRLRDMETRTGREYQGNISNWVSICESRERSRLAREQVRERLNEALGGRRIHNVTDELLQSGWRRLLEMACANSGMGSSRWRGYWRIIWSLHRMTGGDGEPGEDDSEHVDFLIDEARDALAYIGADPIEINDLLGRVETAVRRVRSRLDRDDDYLLFSPLAPDPESEPDVLPTGIPAAEWEQAVSKVDELPLGALLWMRAKDGSKALRLIWRNGDGSRLAVTDTLGKKVKVLRRTRLAEALARGQARAQAPTGKRMVARAADAALSEMQERLKYHETHDPITGLANQRRLIGSLTQLLLREAGSERQYALGFLELDRYDTLTSTYGYSVGERMLTTVAELLQGVVADADCVAYMGGSRFGFLAPVMDREHATEIGESIRAGLTVMPFDLQGKPFRISGSLGMAVLVSDTSSPEKLISAASVACLAAQREGGDRVVLFREDNEIIARQLDHMRGWAQAEDVIKAGRRKLRYQRIVPIDPETELKPHCEILLSVYDDQGVPLPLQSFIAAAEAFNMMREVDRQVIDETFNWIHGHPDAVREIGGVAINLSGQSLSDPDLLRYIRAGLDRLSIPVELVSFEVTETAAIVNLDQAAIILEDIKALGCRIALDDFGAGMSSYNYLKRLPVDYVKIDGSFVRDILVSPHDRQIVKSFNEIAHFMGKRTIAEYVENQEILELLRDIGVDYAQGYAIEKPQFIEAMP